MERNAGGPVERMERNGDRLELTFEGVCHSTMAATLAFPPATEPLPHHGLLFLLACSAAALRPA